MVEIHDQDCYSSLLQDYVNTFSNSFLLEAIDQDIEKGLHIYHNVILKVKPNTILHELIYEKVINMICIQVKLSTAFKPAILRDIIEEALNWYPRNTLFLIVYGWNEGRTKLDNRVRRFISNHVNTHPSHILWQFSLWTELHQRNSPNIQVIRSNIQECFETRQGSSSLELWMLAIDLETRYGEIEKAKALYFRALDVCPWSKGIMILIVDLVMMAFDGLKEVFSQQEKEEIRNILIEKEFRVITSF